MADKKYDVFGVGNSLVDVLAQVDDATLEDLKLNKGGMALVSPEQQGDILERVKDPSLTLASGGSAANTMVAVRQSGGTGVYTGKVAHDSNGEFYKKDLQHIGIEFYVEPGPVTDGSTGTSVILTTPDAERTMCTHLGISTSLSKSDMNFDLLDQSKISYVEGYLWDAEGPRAACIETFEQSKKRGIRTSFTFSDPFLLGRFGKEFHDVVDQYCDIVFCNADEAKIFQETDSVGEAAEKMSRICELVFITDGGDGCFVIENGNIEKVGGFDVNAIDTNGAGDAFAGAALYGLTNGMTAQQSAHWGNYFASQVVSKMGARLSAAPSKTKEEILA